ncbi:hypothetical protein MNV49_006800 [Pseudohyphozyma bogoriensis]|nr:hypothetical protein MNV49_006800 [Pseudohyphozyma bogoriensis]
MSGKHSMSQSDASRIQSAEAKSGNDPGFASRAQSAADRAAYQASQASGGGGGGGAAKSSGQGQSGQGKK